MIMDMNKITTSSPVSMSLIVLAIGGAWGIFSFFSPKFTMISTNSIEIKSQDSRVSKLESGNEKFHEYFLKISASLSEIKGELKGMSERRKND